MRSANPRPLPIRVNRTFLPVLGLLVAVLAVFELTDLDLRVQDQLFDFGRHRWVLGWEEQPWNAVLYSGAKQVVTGVGVIMLALAVSPAKWQWRRRIVGEASRADFLIVVLTLAATPALVGWGKDVTNVFCPFEIRRYGGDAPYVKVFDRYPAADRPARRGRGFPAGHASGGFALVALAGLARTRRGQYLGLAVGIVVGGGMGAYQMLRGAHYLSHTLVTAILAWLVFLTWRRIFRRRESWPRIKTRTSTSETIHAAAGTGNSGWSRRAPPSAE